MEQTIREIVRPFPSRYIRKNPSGGGEYVSHHIVNQRLIQVLGVPPTFQLVEIVRGSVAPIIADSKANSKRGKEGRPEIPNAIVGVVARLVVVIDGKSVTVEEAGDCEEPHNWTTDGQRLKDAMSDAYKRCAMRLGCGLHLWSGEEFFLFDRLGAPQDGAATSPGEATQSPQEPSAPPTVPESGSPPVGGCPAHKDAPDPDCDNCRFLLTESLGVQVEGGASDG